MFLAAVPPLAVLLEAGVKARAETAFGPGAGAGIRAGIAFRARAAFGVRAGVTFGAGAVPRGVFPFRGGSLLRFWWSCCLLWSCRLRAIWMVLRILLGL